MSKNIRYALIVFGLLLLWLFSGVLINRDTAGDRSTDSPEDRLTQVEVIDSRARNYQPYMRFNARTEPYRLISLRAETSGPIVATEVTEGSFVETGTVLGKIATEERQFRVVEARARLEQTQLEYRGALELHAKGLLSESEVARNKFLLDAALAALESAEWELSRINIVAPFDGILNERHVELGDFIQRGQAYAEFLQLDPIKAVFQISESEVNTLNPDERLQLTLSDGRELSGTFLFRSAKADQHSRAFKVEAVFDNPDQAVLADLTGVISTAAKQVMAHAVPAAVLSLDTAGQLIVKAVDQADIVGAHPVTIVSDDKESVWITGLPERAKVIVAGYEYAGIGEQVRVALRTDATDSRPTVSSQLNR